MLLKNSELEIAESIDADFKRSVQARHAIFSCTTPEALKNLHVNKLEQVQKALLYLHHEDIPIHLIGKICQEMRVNSDTLTPEENFELNKHEASDLVYRLQERDLLQEETSVNYPNGSITLQPDLFAMQLHPDDETIEILLKALLKMISKDNTERNADARLHVLSPHIDALGVHVNKYLMKNFDASDKNEKTFVFAINVSYLLELLAQSIIQGRKEDPAVKSGRAASDILKKAAHLVWAVLSSFYDPGFSFSRCFKPASTSDDVLLYNERNDPAKVGAEIAKKAKASGKKVNSQFIEKCVLSSTNFRKTHLDQFITNTMAKLHITEPEAKAELQEIDVLIQNKSHCQPRHFEILRKTHNLLPTEQLQLTFFSDRLSMIFHTNGRQVLYLQDKMTDSQQKECRYYTLLAHHIAKASSPEPGVSLLSEYITLANAILPRLLQNRRDETAASKMKNLNEARILCDELLNVNSEYYENGHFCLVKGSDYSMINIYKYLVKANTKMLKYCSKDELPQDAKDKCEDMLTLAYRNYFLDMVPHVIIQGAKFYAAAGYFPEAFDAFSAGFVMNANGKSYGILRLLDSRPKAVAWAVQNFCYAIDAYSSSKVFSPEKLQNKASRAKEYCKMIINLESKEIGKDWMAHMLACEKKMELLLE